jgi:hypothetical protein
MDHLIGFGKNASTWMIAYLGSDDLLPNHSLERTGDAARFGNKVV